MKKGGKHSDESKEKMRLANLGKRYSVKTEFKKGQTSHNKGKKASKETIKKLRESHLGQSAWNKGKKGYKAGKEHWSFGKKRLDMTGEKSNFWKGGVTEANRLIRANSETKHWRLAIYERDLFLCQMPDCDKVKRNLNAHHIKTFSKYPELRFELSNGITLCEKCHEKTFKKEEVFEKLFMEIIKLKTPATAPTKISCTISRSLTAN